MRLMVTIVLFATAVVGCSPDLETFAQRSLTESERRFSIDYLELLQDTAIDSAFAQLVPDLQSPEVRQQLEGAAAVLADVPLDSLMLIGVNVHQGPGDRRHVNLSYEVAVDDGYVVTNVATQRSGDVTQVEGFSARPTAESIIQVHAFTVADQTPLHFLWLGMLGLMPLVCLTVAVLIVRSKGMPKRWLWVGIALLAAPVFVMNWTSGSWTIRPLAFVLAGAGLSNGGPGTPWIVSFGFPLGAAVALWKRAQWGRSFEGST